jgi:hypothetical protein
MDRQTSCDPLNCLNAPFKAVAKAPFGPRPHGLLCLAQ